MLAFQFVVSKNEVFPEPAAGSFQKRNLCRFAGVFVKSVSNKKLIKRVSFLSCRIGIVIPNVATFDSIPPELAVGC